MENQILYSLVDIILNKGDITAIYKEHIKKLDIISPDEVFGAMNELLKKGMAAEEILPIVDKVINVLYRQLSAYSWNKPGKGTFIFYLLEENKGLKEILGGFKLLMKKQDISAIVIKGSRLIESLGEYNIHLLKLENILFPSMEKKRDIFMGLSIMWALHDETRVLLEQAKEIFADKESNLSSINEIVGRLYFKYYGLIQKQELLLFPAAVKWIGADEFDSLLLQSFDFGFVFIDEPEKPAGHFAHKRFFENIRFETKTGMLNYDQLKAIFSSIPFDITVIDENDEVIYFSDNAERIFARAESIIGRKVQNCHPPKSLSMVEKILGSFKENSKDEEVFWINSKGKIILIKYIALRDDDGRYLGALELTQDITSIQKLEGEKRLIEGDTK